MRTHLDGAVYSAAATANGSMMLLCVLSDIRKWRCAQPTDNGLCLRFPVVRELAGKISIFEVD
jgi:hypothetical protein